MALPPYPLSYNPLLLRALDDDKFMLDASLDLSSAFDVVNIDLLIIIVSESWPCHVMWLTWL
jgi:hypothetical protein